MSRTTPDPAALSPAGGRLDEEEPVAVKPRWLIALLTALVLMAVALSGSAPRPASAAPADPDGTETALQKELDQVARSYLDAKTKLDGARKRQEGLTQSLAQTAQRIAALETEVAGVASAAYRGQRLSVTMVALGGSESSSVLHDAMTIDYLTRRENRDLHDLAATKRVYAQQRDSLANLTSRLAGQVTELEKQKKKVETALARTGGAPASNGITVGAGDAQAAPRNADGSWPPESCSVKDPTPAAGCITPRMLHAYQQARAAGFTHYTSCYRPSGGGEHPKGRACDFAAATNGFEGVASGADKTYGDRLAAWCLANAERIAVLYVIWFKQIWLPGIGWRAYQGDGTPAGDHYNHVHLSVQ